MMNLQDRLAAVLCPLAEASTLPPEAYTSPTLYEREVERVFRRGWISIARADRVAQPGDYLAVDFLGEPLVLVRDLGGSVRVLSRVCRHRSMEIVEGSGNRRTLQCPYHLWTYALDGRLLAAPEMERAEGFDKTGCRLPELRSEIWQGWVFASFDPDVAPLAPDLEPLRRALAPYHLDEMRTTAPLVYDSPWNWKVMVDNFMESYHHAGTHGDTLQPGFPAAGTFAEDVDGPYSILRNPARDRSAPVPTFLPPIAGLSHEARTEFVVVNVFPFHLFAVAPDHMLWYRIEPRALESFRLSIFPCVPPGSADLPGVAELRSVVDAIHQQDIRACTGIQTGLRSRFAGQGRFSHLEKAVWQFQRFLVQRISDEARGEGR